MESDENQNFSKTSQYKATIFVNAVNYIEVIKVWATPVFSVKLVLYLICNESSWI